MRATRWLSAGLLAVESLLWGCGGLIPRPDRIPQARQTETAETAGAEKPRPEPRGPAPHRSQHPLLMTFLDFELRGARTLPAGKADLDFGITYTSMFQSSASEDGRSVALLDGEWARPEFNLRWGLADGLELFAAVPFLYTTSGFLDDFILDYHDALHLGQDDRDRAPSDRFGVRIVHEGKTIYSLEEDAFGLGDIPVGLALALLEEEVDSMVPGLLARAAVELPTGDEDKGFGNGKFDLGVGLVAEKSLGIFTVTAGIDYTWIRRPDSMKATGVDLEDLIGAFVGGEVRVGGGLSGLVALDYLSQPLSGLSLRETRRDQLMLIFGGAIDLGRDVRLRIDFTEDIIQDVSPDFSARLGLDLRF